MKNNLIKSAKTTGIVTLFCIASFVVFGLQIAIFGESFSNLLMMNPIISGFLHVGLSHFGCNIIVLFLILLAPINSSYDIKKIFWVTFVISILYLPFPIMGITPAAVGISGTCMFLMTRYFFTWKKYPKIGMAIILLIGISELANILDVSDGTAHGVHVLGIILGYLSLNSGIFNSIFPQWISKKIAQ